MFLIVITYEQTNIEITTQYNNMTISINIITHRKGTFLLFCMAKNWF